MNTFVRNKWVEALRSGKYEQTVARLKKWNSVSGNESYCCLGVLCDIVPGVVWDDFGEAIYRSVCSGVVLPNTLMEDLGITDDQHCHLSSMNDKVGCSFAEIADWIEENM